MLREIVIEEEMPGEFQTTFGLSVMGNTGVSREHDGAGNSISSL